jgi:hypothetical protein
MAAATQLPMTAPVAATIGAGMVACTEMVLGVDGRWYRGFAGAVEIIDAAAALGITPGRNDQSWYARVSGNSGIVYVPGCKVAAVFDLLGAGGAGVGDVLAL